MKRSTILKSMIEGVRKDLKDIQDIQNDQPLAAESVTQEPAAEKPEEIKPAPLPESSPLVGKSLGSREFKREYGLSYAYLTGSMVHGIASSEMVIRMAKAGMLGFLGTGGMSITAIEKEIEVIKSALGDAHPFGLNLLHKPENPQGEEETVDLYMKHGIRVVEASAFLMMTPALVKYHAKGLTRGADGGIRAANRIIAKLSRPEVAEVFLSPAPEAIVKKLLAEHKITEEEAELSMVLPVADAVCIEADSGGHTDGGNAYVLMPALMKLRDEMQKKYGCKKKIYIGAAGGIGTPEAAAAAFVLGADFIVTGSINQCTVEAGTSDAVKDLLQQMDVQDTEYAPAGDMFELGARVQVLKKGVFFPARANKLFDLYRQYPSLDAIDQKTKTQIQDKYFKRSFESVYDECRKYFKSIGSDEIERAEKNPKIKMAIIFKWYFHYASQLAKTGDAAGKVDYQIHCGPCLGAFNQWVKGTPLENWRARHVDDIAVKLMDETASVLHERFMVLQNNG